MNRTRNRAPIDMRHDLQSGIGGDLRNVLGTPSNHPNGDDDVMTVTMPTSTSSGKKLGPKPKPKETHEAPRSKESTATNGSSNFLKIQVSSASLINSMLPPKPKNMDKSHEGRPADQERLSEGVFPEKARLTLFPVTVASPAVASLDHTPYHGGSVTPKVPSSPTISTLASPKQFTPAIEISRAVAGFKIGEEFLTHRSMIVDSDSYKERFLFANNASSEMHDGMCHPREWELRQKENNCNPFQPTYEAAYANHELRRETILTTYYRSIRGITKTLDHIQKSFKGDDSAALQLFNASIYPTLRAAENDLTYGGNQVYSMAWICAVERMIKFCMYMYDLNTKSGNISFSDMHSKSLEYAQKFIFVLMKAYKEMWSHHVMPPNCEEFCALSLATSALARNATSNNKGGGIAALCRVYFSFPSAIRQKPSVKRTLSVLCCYFSDNISRFFELLDKNCPYLVVLMCSSEFYQIRCRFMKNFFATKLEKIPSSTLARFKVLMDALMFC
jgi:hypothetical protein